MKRKRSNVNGNFSSYLFRVLKQIHPQLSMTNKAMKVMDDFMHDIFHRLASEAAGLVKLANRSTLTSAEIQTSTRLILPGELSKHAVMEATKALATFIRSRASDRRTSQPKTRIKNISTSNRSFSNESVAIDILNSTQMDASDAATETGGSVADQQNPPPATDSCNPPNLGTEQGVSATAAVDLETADASEEEADPMLEVESSEMDKNQNVKVKASLEIRKKDHQLGVVDDSSEVDEGYKTFQEDPECPDVDFSIPMDCTTKKRPVDPSEDDIIDRKKKGVTGGLISKIEPVDKTITRI